MKVCVGIGSVTDGVTISISGGAEVDVAVGIATIWLAVADTEADSAVEVKSMVG